MPMNPEIKSKWIAALRSGNYQQTSKVLRQKDRYCCLGVLCDLSQKGSWEDSTYRVATTKYLSYLPPIVRTWAGLNTDDKNQLIHEAENDLSQMNDEGKSFPEIADWIEQNL